jgi:cobalamin biosynthesis Mg chelatase CobN
VAAQKGNCKNKEEKVDVTTIRIIAGVLAVVVLFIIIWRRRRNIEE